MDINSFALGYSAGKKKGGVELNIAYGDTPPEDTTKLWVKTSEPSGVVVSTEKAFTEGGQEESLIKTGATLTRNGKCVGAYGEKIFVFGGCGSLPSADSSNTVYSFDAVSKTTSYLGTILSYKVCYAAYAVYGTKIYAFGGLQNTSSTGVLNTILEFDMPNKKCEISTAVLPNNLCLYGACAATVGSRIYIFGGASTFKGNGTTTVLIFDPETKEWLETTRNLPTAIKYASCAAVGDKIYLFGGMDSANYKVLTDIVCYDTVTNEFETLSAKLPEGRHSIGCCAVENIICLFGGCDNYSEYYASEETRNIWCFNVDTGEVLVSDLSFDQWICASDSCAVGKKAYITHHNGVSSMSSIYEYVPQLGYVMLDRDRLQIIPNPTNNIFPFFNTDSLRVEIGVEKVYKGNESNQAKPAEAALYKDGTWQTI